MRMHKIVILTIMSSLTILSCGKKDDGPGLFIKTSDIQGIDEKQARQDSLTKVTSDYFEISLASYSDGKYYKAKKDILEPKSLEDFRVKFLFVTDSLGNELQFQDATDFLNFMSARGYEMSDQTKHRYGVDYTFKKRKGEAR